MPGKRLSFIAISMTLTALLVLYLFTLPSTVQQGDTGELVINSYFLRLSHPPGYPLFHFFNFLGTNFIPSGTLYWRAALVQVTFSLMTIGILLYSCRQSITSLIMGVLLSLLLATSHLFWKYSILPDVFSLNNFFIVAVCTIYLKSQSPNKLLVLLGLFSLSLANHHTMIFLAPLMIHVIAQAVKAKNYKQLLLGSVLGIFIFSVMYLSLFFFDDTSTTSWGKLNNLSTLFFHLIRKDYGTFQLTSLKDQAVYSEILSQYFIELNQNFWSLFLVLITFLIFFLKKKIRFEFQHLVLLFTFISYLLLFFYRAQISPEGFKHEVLSRFFLLPNVLFIILILDLVARNQFSKKIALFISFLLIINIGTNLKNNYADNDLSKNTILEDYFKNMLSLVPDNSILLAQGDVSLFNMYYIQQALSYKPSVQVISPILLRYPWYQEKVKISNPDFGHLETSETIKYIYKNIKRPVFVVPYFFQLFIAGYDLGVEVSGLVGLVNDSGKVVYQCKSFEQYPFIRHFPQDNLLAYNIYRQYFNNYADCYFYKSHQLNAEGMLKEAYDFSTMALSIAPSHLPAKYLNCEIRKKLQLDFDRCNEEFRRILQHDYDYYNFTDWLKHAYHL